MSKLFRTEKWLTVDQLIRAWSPELARGEGDPKQYEQDLRHILLQDIGNGRLDNSGPPREGQRSGLRLITDESYGFIEGRQLLDPIRNGYPWMLNRVALMKEAVLDFAQRHQLPPPSWCADSANTPTGVLNNTTPIAAKAAAPPSRGKQPRLLKYLSERFPDGVPEPGLCPRHTLKSDILEWDPRLGAVDEATLKKAIEKHNASLVKQKF
jgi:hypothetical protein